MLLQYLVDVSKFVMQCFILSISIVFPTIMSRFVGCIIKDSYKFNFLIETAIEKLIYQN